MIDHKVLDRCPLWPKPKEKLMYAGRVGTGFNTETLERLGSKLAQLEKHHCPFSEQGLPQRGAHWVKPKLVVQIAASGRLKKKLPHPRFVGLREDETAGRGTHRVAELRVLVEGIPMSALSRRLRPDGPVNLPTRRSMRICISGDPGPPPPNCYGGPGVAARD
jgi:hypothetical protein